jgi:hypothetical protein
MNDKHFLFSALGIEPVSSGLAMKVVKPGKKRLQRYQRLQQLVSASKGIVRRTA